MVEMVKPARRIAWTIAAVGLLLLLVVPTCAVAADTAAAPVVRPFEIASYARDEGVSKAAAERSLLTQRAGAGIVEQLRSSLGADFAGVWFDNEAGEFVVPLVADSRRDAATAKLDAAGIGFRTVAVDSTWSELEVTQGRLDRALADLIEANLVQTSRDPVANSVVVYESTAAKQEARARILAAASSAGVEVDVVEQPAAEFEVRPSACNEPHRVCDRPLRGGVKIEVNATGGWCTAGFKAIGKTFGNRFLLTAGHCTNGTTTWRSRDATLAPHDIGTTDGSVFPGRDYGKIKVTGPSNYWDQPSWPTQVAEWGGGNQSAPISWEGWNYLGQYVCHSGAYSGTSCGWVQVIGKTVNYPEGAVGNLVEVEGPGYCVIPGDSGGSVFAGNVAVGLISGGLKMPEGVCSTVGYHAEITEATTALGVTVAPRIGAPPVPDELGFIRYNLAPNTVLDTYTGAPKFKTLASHSLTGYPNIGDPQNIQGMAIDWTGDGIDELGFLRWAYLGNAWLDTYTGAPGYKTLASHSATGYPAITDPQNMQALAIDWTGDGIDELGFIRFNYPGNTFMDTYVGAPNYNVLASHSTTGYPAIADPQNIQALAIDSMGNGVDELAFVRLNHFTGNVHIDTYTGAPNYQTLAANCDTGYPKVTDPANVQVIAIDWTGDGIDELGFLRYNPKTGNTHLDTYVGAPCYNVLASNSDTGYPEITDPQNIQGLAINTG